MKTKDIKSKIKEFFMKNPSKKLRVRQIERELGLPLPSVIRYTKELESEKILRSQKIANIIVYTVNNSKEFFIEKKLFNLRQIYDSGIIDFLKKEYSNPVIVLFGSYLMGEDNEESDIDLYIETKTKKEFNFKKFERFLGRKIQVFNFKNLKEINSELANSIINGLVLNNQLEVFL